VFEEPASAGAAIHANDDGECTKEGGRLRVEKWKNDQGGRSGTSRLVAAEHRVPQELSREEKINRCVQACKTDMWEEVVLEERESNDEGERCGGPTTRGASKLNVERGTV